ncbi:hypothetical protein ACLB2K_062898 [Fragaria x ananassa]
MWMRLSGYPFPHLHISPALHGSVHPPTFRASEAEAWRKRGGSARKRPEARFREKRRRRVVIGCGAKQTKTGGDQVKKRETERLMVKKLAKRKSRRSSPRRGLQGVPHEPVLVVGPRQLKSYLDAYQRLEDLDMQFLDCRNTTDAFLNAPSRATDSNKHHSSPGKDRQQKVDSTLFAEGSRMESYWKKPGSPVDDAVLTLQKMLSEAGLEDLISVPVIHCSQAFGVVLKASKRLNSVGKATFEDGMEDEAIKKNHSTTEEAIGVGNSAGVYRVLLTHFSQRYPKIPVFDEAHMHKTCIAFDLMSINMADLPVLPKLLSYLKMLFKNEMTVDELD